MMHALSLTRDMALGNGTRRGGDVLASVNGVTPNELQAAAYELVGGDLKKLPGTITLEEGVTPAEILTLLRNPQLCQFTELPTQPRSEREPAKETKKPAKETKKP